MFYEILGLLDNQMSIIFSIFNLLNTFLLDMPITIINILSLRAHTFIFYFIYYIQLVVSWKKILRWQKMQEDSGD